MCDHRYVTYYWSSHSSSNNSSKGKNAKDTQSITCGGVHFRVNKKSEDQKWPNGIGRFFSLTWFTCQDLNMGKLHIKHLDYWLILRNQAWPAPWKGSTFTGSGWLPLSQTVCSSVYLTPPHPRHLAPKWGHVILITKAFLTSNKSSHN